MKRMTKLLAVLAVGAVATAGVVGLAACGEKGISGSAKGEYSYESHNRTYGIKVEVTVENGKITKVERLKHDWTEATDMVMGDWDGGANYNKEINNELKKFNGLSVDDVLDLEVAVTEEGAPETQKTGSGEDAVANPDFMPLVIGDTNLVLAGSTQSSGRLVLAVQDALENLQAEQEAE